MSAAGAAPADERLLEPFSLDQAGATAVLVLGAVGLALLRARNVQVAN